MNVRVHVLAMVMLVVFVSACTTSDESTAETDPEAVLDSYIDAYNRADIDALIHLFNDDSVIVGHPTDRDPEAADLASIRRLHVEDLTFGEQYEVFNVEVDGDAVVWDSMWGEDGCVQGHLITVAGDDIVRWEWGEFVDCADLR